LNNLESSVFVVKFCETTKIAYIRYKIRRECVLGGIAQ